MNDMQQSDIFLTMVEANSLKIKITSEQESYRDMHCDWWAQYIQKRNIPLGVHPLTDCVRVMQLLSEPREFDESIVMYYRDYAFAQNLSGNCLFTQSNTKCSLATCLALDSYKIWRFCNTKFLRQAHEEGIGSMFMYENLVQNKLFQIADKDFLQACIPYKEEIFCEMTGDAPLEAIRTLMVEDFEEKMHYRLMSTSLLLKIFTMTSIPLGKMRVDEYFPIVEFGLDVVNPSLRKWRPEIHKYFDAKFRSIVHTLFLAHKRKFKRMPRVLVHFIIRILQEIWY